MLSCVNDCDNDWFIIRRGVTATATPRLHFAQTKLFHKFALINKIEYGKAQ